MAKIEPLSDEEELFWRALMRIVIVLPRYLDRDMVQAVGMTANEYTTIMILSEAPNREMRMADPTGRRSRISRFQHQTSELGRRTRKRRQAHPERDGQVEGSMARPPRERARAGPRSS
jgi:hypothetical protein